MTRSLGKRVYSGVVANLPWVVAFMAVARPILTIPDPALWSFLAIALLSSVTLAVITDPQNLQVKQGQGQRTQIIVGLSLIATNVSGAAELARIGPIMEFSPSVRWAGVGMVAAGYLLRIWAVRVNPFFSGLIAVQLQRNHSLVHRGPYQWMRHPGYAGLLPVFVGTPMVLSSMLALIPALLGLGGVLYRTATEDHFLHQNLEGYENYQARVRFRLIPGLY